jgi:hypothetical protein
LLGECCCWSASRETDDEIVARRRLN